MNAGNQIVKPNGKELIMSVNNFNRKRGYTITDNHAYRVLVVLDDDPYWDEGLNYYKSKGKRGNKKQIFNYQRRMYRTWKHNRNTQYII